jgi:recombination protein RecT
MTTAVQQSPHQRNVDTIQSFLFQNQKAIAAVLPKTLTPERLTRLAVSVISRQQKLAQCTPATLLGAVLKCAQLGLEPDILGEAYLVPFWNNKAQPARMEVQFIPGYKGLLKLARNTGEIATILAHEVYEGDTFTYAYGLNPSLEHIPCRKVKERGEIVAFYAAAKLKDGSFQFEVMEREEVDEVRDKFSKAKNEGPWVNNYREMGLKTVLRRLCKLLPASTELKRAVALDEYAEAGLPQGLASDLGVPAEEEDAASAAQPDQDMESIKEQMRQANGTKPTESPTQADSKPAEQAPMFDGVQIPDDQWAVFLKYLGADPDRNQLSDAVKKKLKVSKLADLKSLKDRSAFYLTLLDMSQKEQVLIEWEPR